MKDRFTPKKDATQDPADIIAAKQHAKATIESDAKHRVSLNIPEDKYDVIKKKSKSKGLTLTAYIMILINNEIENT